MIHYRIRISIILLLGLVSAAPAQRQMENLTRGIVAVKQAGGGVYIGWRLFGTDPETVTFNLYRLTGSSAAVKVNEIPIAGATNYIDKGAEQLSQKQLQLRISVQTSSRLSQGEMGWDVILIML